MKKIKFEIVNHNFKDTIKYNYYLIITSIILKNSYIVVSVLISLIYSIYFFHDKLSSFFYSFIIFTIIFIIISKLILFIINRTFKYQTLTLTRFTHVIHMLYINSSSEYIIMKKMHKDFKEILEYAEIHKLKTLTFNSHRNVIAGALKIAAKIKREDAESYLKKLVTKGDQYDKDERFKITYNGLKFNHLNFTNENMKPEDKIKKQDYYKVEIYLDKLFIDEDTEMKFKTF